MVSSARQAIACILLIFSAFVYVRSQSAAEKVTSTITGKVTVKGKGVPGIGVSLTLREASSASTTRHKAVTDDQGNYRIPNVPPGTYTVAVGAPAFPSAGDVNNQKTVIVTRNETIEDVNFALLRGGVITGRVTDSEGHPLIEEDVSVFAANTQDRYAYSGFARAQTDDRGVYRIFGLRPGRYTVSAGQDSNLSSVRGRAGYQRTFHPDATEAGNATVIELDEGEEVTNVDITVGRAVVRYSASGRIIDGETGRPVADVPYGVQMFINPNSSSSMTTGAVSNSQGEFKLPNLVPGKYAVFFETPPNSEWRADALRFEVTDEDVTGLTAKTSRGASASGVVVLEGTNDKTVYAKLLKSRLFASIMSERDFGGTSPQATINPDGSFRVGGLRPGTLLFGFVHQNPLRVVRIERDGIVYSRGVEIKEAEQVTGLKVIVSEANGIVRGVVKLEKGAPVENGHFIISLRRLGENEGGPFFSSDQSPEIDARGQFVAEGLLPGTYEVTAAYAPDMKTPWRRTKQQVVVSNGTVTNVTLTIDPEASVPPVPPRP